MSRFLRLPEDELLKLANLQRRERLRKILALRFSGPLIESWDIDLKTFRIDVIPNRKLVPGGRKRFEFTEVGPDRPPTVEPGFQEFLSNASLSADATAEELAFLTALKF